MILNQTTINNAIAKAKCCLANKTIEYFDKLSIGIDKDCLFKESIVLKGYIDTLSNFQIVGSKTTCDCCIGGNYTFNLGGVNSESQIQFNCNNEGWIVSNNTNYPFTYIYDSYNNLLNIQLTKDFPNLIVNGTFNTDTNGWTISNTDDWIWSSYNGGSMLYNGADAGGVASQDILTVGETYSVEFDIYLENQDYEGKADLVVSLGTNSLVVFPFSAITTTKTIHIKTTLVCLGNSTFSFSLSHTNDDGYKNLYIDNVVVKKLSLYTLNTKFNDNCDIIVESSNFPLFYTASIVVEDTPVENTTGTINIYNELSALVHSLEIPYETLIDPQAVVNYWNENSDSGFTLSYSDSTYIFYSPAFELYTDWIFEFDLIAAPFTAVLDVTTYGFFKQQVTVTLGNGDVYQSDIFTEATLADLLPVIQEWLLTVPVEITCSLNTDTLTFTTNDNSMYHGYINLYVTDDLEEFNYIAHFEASVLTDTFEPFEESFVLQSSNPCKIATVEQTCLTNSQVIKIIEHINKICKNC